MRDIRIYQDGELSTGTELTLDDRAARHVSQVLRMKVGDELCLFNGDGHDYEAHIASLGKKHTAVQIDRQIPNHVESDLRVHLYQGISKGDRMDSAMQKSVEMGVTSITPIICERTVVRTSSERSEKKVSHWKNIIISACEQSGRAIVPTLHSITSFEQSISELGGRQVLLLHPVEATAISEVALEADDIHIMIGPEGGFSEAEVKRASEQGIVTVAMGKRILRTETAPIAILSVLQARFGDY